MFRFEFLMFLFCSFFSFCSFFALLFFFSFVLVIPWIDLRSLRVPAGRPCTLPSMQLTSCQAFLVALVALMVLAAPTVRGRLCPHPPTRSAPRHSAPNRPTPPCRPAVPLPNSCATTMAPPSSRRRHRRPCRPRLAPPSPSPCFPCTRRPPCGTVGSTDTVCRSTRPFCLAHPRPSCCPMVRPCLPRRSSPWRPRPPPLALPWHHRYLPPYPLQLHRCELDRIAMRRPSPLAPRAFLFCTPPHHHRRLSRCRPRVKI